MGACCAWLGRGLDARGSPAPEPAIDEGRDDLRDALALALNSRGAVWAGSGRIVESVADYDAALVAHRATG